jgi:predicted alpha-1,6-mannanase (GH76 family)
MKSPAGLGWILLPALLLVLRLPPNGFAQTAATYHARADQALQSFLLKFWDGGQQYLSQNYPSSNSLTGYWTFAQGWDALLDGVERTGGRQYLGLIESFYLGQNQRGWYSGYYDDECWMTLALMRAYDLTTNLTYLNEAQAIYADIEGGWDNTCCGPAVGGLWWDKAHTQKATAANAGAALAGARLYERTGNAAYLSFAQQVYSFWFTNMVDQSTFQVCDHLDTDGTKVWWQFTYNEGLMIGASVELNRATGSATYLNNANNIAGFMTAHEIISTAYGNALYDGDNAGCGGDCHEFKGPAYRYLMLLYQQNTTKSQYSYVLRSSANAVWNLARNTNSTVFAVNWAGPTMTNVDEPQDDAACMALNLYAGQSGAYPGSGLPANQYEAENATSHNLSLEAIYPNFTGWGYLAGWNANGQSVDFHVTFPSPGARTLTFRYAAGAGNASRAISINGVNIFTNQAFAGTGSWTNYSAVSVSYNFHAGTNTISMAYNSALGSGNYLNLDNLTVSDLRFTGITALPGGPVQLSWNAVTGQTYHVQFASPLGSRLWSNLGGGGITATSTTATATDPAGTNAQRFYRIAKP